ncbi:MAG: hypothetical protein D6826_08490, partial [Alphaproteobacteria bacterium]
AMLNAGQWDDAMRYGDALEAFSRPEPVLWSTFFVARGRALAAWGRGCRDAGLCTRLHDLAREADRIGLITAIPALRAAVALAPGPDGRKT